LRCAGCLMPWRLIFLLDLLMMRLMIFFVEYRPEG